MSVNFNNKVVIITGASSGIGKAAAFEFGKLGSRVVLAARSEERLKAVSADMESRGYESIYVVTDVSKEEQCRNLIERTVETFGTIDILINNAGLSMRALFSEVDISVLRRLMDVNFWGAVYCTRYALPYLIANRGSLVGVSSIAGFHGLPGRTGYSASKFALQGFMETIRIEYLKTGLHVMVIAPGFTATEVRLRALTADGSEQGESPRDEKKMDTPEYVARWIIKGIKKKKRNKLLTWEGRLTALFQRILPDFVDSVYYHEMAREPHSPLK
ncbi:MAG: SDR family oxidoreductase [Bacteroidales bacterium]|jgi:NAD(P)-dependent dehydrogenase (short-subunit alcohol dehydrogenase family)|nr:SDR family oxidoreductase [Bacteroidales bacterium]